MTSRQEPIWLSRTVIDSIHQDQLREHGGLAGLRDENALESALARPRHRWLHDADADLALLTAAYGFGLTQNHPYRDANKRTAFLAMVVFLGLNGFDLNAPDAQVVTVMVSLAAGHTSETQLALWLRRQMTPRL